MRPDGSEVRQLTYGANGEMSSHSNFPVWSPDGRDIAYLKSGAVRVMNRDGEDDRVVAQLDGDLALRATLPHPYELAGFDSTEAPS